MPEEEVKLKPCPFCGATDIEVRKIEGVHPPKFYVACKICQSGTGGNHTAEIEAIGNWNSRPPSGEREHKEGFRERFIEAVIAEVERAYKKHGREQWGRHEFWGVFAEEWEVEMKQAIQQDLPQGEVEKELIQMAAVCLRYFETRDRYREPRQLAAQEGEVR